MIDFKKPDPPFCDFQLLAKHAGKITLFCPVCKGFFRNYPEWMYEAVHRKVVKHCPGYVPDTPATLAELAQYHLGPKWYGRLVRVIRYVRSTAKFLANGAPVCTPAEIEQRFEQGCMLCTQYNVAAGGCELCGCSANLNRRWLFNKLARRTEQCPADPPRWPRIDTWQQRFWRERFADVLATKSVIRKIGRYIYSLRPAR